MEAEDWYVEAVTNVSLEGLKRFKFRIILNRRLEKSKINKVIDQLTLRLQFLDTPPNPTHSVKAGTTEVDALFIDVYCSPTSRRECNLLLDPSSFVCLANYYRDNSVPRLEHGGIPFPIWRNYKKNTVGNVEYAWNPGYVVA